MLTPRTIPTMPTDMLRRLLLTLGIGLAAVAVALAPARAQDAADMVVRLNRVENVARQLSGQIEQLQYENRQLKEQLRKFQEDVEYRFQEGKGGGGRSPAAARPPAAAAPPADGGTYGTNPGAGKPAKRGDAFNPDQNPSAPGVPRQLGATTPSTPLPVPPAPRAETRTPETRMANALPPADDADEMQDDGELPPPGLGGPVDLAPPPNQAPTTTAAVEPPGAGSIAATGSGNARADFDAASALIQGRQFEQAEMSLRQFLQSHPRDRNVPKATYWLGETYLQRNRSREAAEQFLKVSTDYASSPVAPEAMMKLGASLNAMGAKAQACATLAEVERKYPSASASLRQGIEREQKRARCAG